MEPYSRALQHILYMYSLTLGFAKGRISVGVELRFQGCPVYPTDPHVIAADIQSGASAQLSLGFWVWGAM